MSIDPKILYTSAKATQHIADDIIDLRIKLTATQSKQFYHCQEKGHCQTGISYKFHTIKKVKTFCNINKMSMSTLIEFMGSIHIYHSITNFSCSLKGSGSLCELEMHFRLFDDKRIKKAFKVITS